ncbi:hypothetical protein [uncultured Gammaproteobacteria bacterium]|uniref:murein hydrolase activator EnvC family protein n=1 Tax=Bathymodiolus heckerae thiotrophic gill symbiont TaxID=1052212 RepID=UPI0010B24E47|nr:M23 family metallopeptidase [Bathymodiolus heckerae thiotrophic gill symbiont]CAC9547632.1 hypothetical protein [uncultured Gammaproteobacteria bacterium]CAC9602782.1 hypothetical protein [uncultured Gammaproteobacteria bacterium]CAC9952337.1 hypothetical protein [uncultured Gammaproteobacteria bacterium]CAC9962174.1 hypothetical protein [uncultured Gammaproteobacteria bacterium]SHN89323.1 hypothetical protein BHECKSOX_1559 [Bathymodiolus heckerae thiotrophic gill symbiont]
MWVKFLSITVILSLTGCYSQSPKQAVIVIEKSSHLENINHQRLNNKSTITHKSRRVTDSTVAKTSQKSRKPSAKSQKKSSNWHIPVNAKVSQTYSKKHSGLAFNTHNGQEIRAIRDGKIIYIGDKMKSYGQMIIMRHPLGFNSTYTQTQALRVNLGDQVKKGEVIASTTSQPFYFEMKKFNQAINPLKYLK